MGLTTNEKPAQCPGRAGQVLPDGNRTYLLIVPRDSIQSAADLMAMRQAGCTKVAVANDKEAYGAGLAALLELEKKQFGVDITSNTGIDPKAANFPHPTTAGEERGSRLLLFSPASCRTVRAQ